MVASDVEFAFCFVVLPLASISDPAIPCIIIPKITLITLVRYTKKCRENWWFCLTGRPSVSMITVLLSVLSFLARRLHVLYTCKSVSVSRRLSSTLLTCLAAFKVKSLIFSEEILETSQEIRK